MFFLLIWYKKPVTSQVKVKVGLNNSGLTNSLYISSFIVVNIGNTSIWYLSSVVKAFVSFCNEVGQMSGQNVKPKYMYLHKEMWYYTLHSNKRIQVYFSIKFPKKVLWLLMDQ